LSAKEEMIILRIKNLLYSSREPDIQMGVINAPYRHMENRLSTP
jgi:hypothetical protein